MSIEKVELELYTAMNNYNKYGTDFNKVIINHISSTIIDKEKTLKLSFGKINLEGLDLALLKYSEILTNCNLLLNDLDNVDIINNLKKSIEDLSPIENNLLTNINEIRQKLHLDDFETSLKNMFNN